MGFVKNEQNAELRSFAPLEHVFINLAQHEGASSSLHDLERVPMQINYETTTTRREYVPSQRGRGFIEQLELKNWFASNENVMHISPFFILADLLFEFIQR